MLVGIASVKLTLDAAAGPLFVMALVYVMLFPAMTVEGVATALRTKSAWVAAATTTVAVAELSPLKASLVA